MLLLASAHEGASAVPGPDGGGEADHAAQDHQGKKDIAEGDRMHSKGDDRR